MHSSVMLIWNGLPRDSFWNYFFSSYFETEKTSVKLDFGYCSLSNTDIMIIAVVCISYFTRIIIFQMITTKFW